jgi:hypothetical protein
MASSGPGPIPPNPAANPTSSSTKPAAEATPAPEPPETPDLSMNTCPARTISGHPASERETRTGSMLSGVVLTIRVRRRHGTKAEAFPLPPRRKQESGGRRWLLFGTMKWDICF